MRTRLGTAGLLALLWIANLAGAAEPVQRAIEWQKSDVTVPPEGGTVAVLILENPGIHQTSFAIRGTIKYEQVKSPGYLEMWNVFPDGSRFFTRTLNRSGPMAELSGTSQGRDFVLPFRSSPGKFPSKLELNVVLPQGGTVSLGPAELVQPFNPGQRQAGAWWGDREGGIVGGGLGSVIGILGAVIGSLVGMGKARRTAVSLAVTTIALCAVLLVAGVTALAMKQPYAVWYPSLLCGAIGTLVMGSMLPAMRRRYAEHELRKMSAADVAA